jgi:hypothetical protein
VHDGIDLAAVLRRAQADTEEHPLAKLELDPTAARRWPAGIAGIDDDVHMAGFYGFTAVCGSAKLGKSIVGYQSALVAAMNGWRVIYVDAELDDWQANQRIRNSVQMAPKNWLYEHPNFVWRQLFKRTSLEVLVNDVAGWVEDYDEKVLVVLDSIHRIAQKMVDRRRRIDFYDALHDLVNWCLTARRMAHGGLGFMVMSEQNKHGGTKGESIEFACDVLLKLKGKASERTTELNVELSREGGGGSLGQYVRDWSRCRFRRPERVEMEEQPELPPLPTEPDDWTRDEPPFPM